MKKKLINKLLECDDYYHAIGYLTALAAINSFKQLWLLYYTFRLNGEHPLSEELQLGELKLRVQVIHARLEDSIVKFWEIQWNNSSEWSLFETHANAAMWTDRVKTFEASTLDDAINFCIVVLKIPAKKINHISPPDVEIADVVSVL